MYLDTNGNGQFDASLEKGASDVAVSDGDNVVLTDSAGAYALTQTTRSLVFICRPANYDRSTTWYARTDTTATADVGMMRIDFPLRPTNSPDRAMPRFVQTSDIHIHGEQDRAMFAAAIEEINQLTPAADFVAATGDLVETGNDLKQLEVYTSTTELSRILWFHVFGNHDANRGEDRTANYKAFMGPDYYSADYGDLHLLMLNSVHKSERQDRWLDADIRLLGRNKKLFVFQHYPPEEAELARFQKYGVKAVFSGHWHSNKMTTHSSGLVNINHPTFIMGGIDGSPSSFRIVELAARGFTSEFRFNDFGKRLHITYPQQQVSGPEHLIAQIYDTSGGVVDARYEITADNKKSGGGALSRLSPLAWHASLAKATTGHDLLPTFDLSVHAINSRGETWATSATISRPQIRDAADVQLAADWPQFMGNPQRTGVANQELSAPLSLRWIAATGATIDYSSPVLYKGRLAIGVKDRDNFTTNGVIVFDARTGQRQHFLQTNAMVSHSPAFVPGGRDGNGVLYAVAAGGSVYGFDVASGEQVTSHTLGGDEHMRWVYAAPGFRDDLLVMGNSPRLLALDPATGAQRWLSTFGKDWISSYASPSFYNDLVIMGAYSLNYEKKPASIYALDAKTGDMRWVNPTGGVHSSVAVHNGRGYATDTRGTFKVIDLATGKDIKKITNENNRAMSTPAVDDEVIIAPTGGGTVYAYSTVDLQQKWVFRAGRSLWRISPYDRQWVSVFSSPTIAGNLVYIGCSDGKLYALDKHTGDVRWFYDFGVPVLATPCISGNALFTAAYDGNVYAFTRSSP